MEITYLDHSGFIARIDGAVLVFDYYRDPSHALLHTLRKYPDLPVVFFVSHHHDDHYNPDIYEIGQQHRRVYVMSNDVLLQNVPSTLEVAGMSKGDVIEGLPGDIKVKAYGSTDEGISFLVTLPDGRNIFHAGDLNDWHWEGEVPARESQKEENAFKTIVNRIAEEVAEIYVAMFPVDTRMDIDFARGARIFLEKIKVDNFFPMHFSESTYKEACDTANYAPANGETHCYCLHKPGETVILKEAHATV